MYLYMCTFMAEGIFLKEPWQIYKLALVTIIICYVCGDFSVYMSALIQSEFYQSVVYKKIVIWGTILDYASFVTAQMRH